MLEAAFVAGLRVEGRGRASSRGRADPGRRLRGSPPRRHRRGDLGVAQPVPRQRHQALRSRRDEAGRGESRSAGRARVAWLPLRAASPAQLLDAEESPDYAHPRPLGRSRVARSPGFASSSTAPTAPRAWSHLALSYAARCGRGRDPRPTRRTQHQRPVRRDPSRIAVRHGRRRASRSRPRPRRGCRSVAGGRPHGGSRRWRSGHGRLRLDLPHGGSLCESTIVATVMSNLGFRITMEQAGIAVVETAVGDRYVLEALDAGGYTMGGEQSGHVIFPRSCDDRGWIAHGHRARRQGEAVRAVTGRARRRCDDPLSAGSGERPGARAAAERRRTASLTRSPRSRRGWSGSGRVLLRPSGTEPLVRVMVEAREDAIAHDAADHLAALVASRWGVDGPVRT